VACLKGASGGQKGGGGEARCSAGTRERRKT
jgi:hypothetical protein